MGDDTGGHFKKHRCYGLKQKIDALFRVVFRVLKPFEPLSTHLTASIRADTTTPFIQVYARGGTLLARTYFSSLEGAHDGFHIYIFPPILIPLGTWW